MFTQEIYAHPCTHIHVSTETDDTVDSSGLEEPSDIIIEPENITDEPIKLQPVPDSPTHQPVDILARLERQRRAQTQQSEGMPWELSSRLKELKIAFAVH